MLKATNFEKMQATLVGRGDELYHLVKRYRASIYQQNGVNDLMNAPELKEIDATLAAWEVATDSARPPVMQGKLPEADEVRISLGVAGRSADPEAAAAAIVDQLERQQQRVQLRR